MYRVPSHTFGFSGTSSRLHAYVQDTVHTDEGQWRIGLLRFSAPNSIPNITEDNNVLTYHYRKQRRSLTIPPGAYSLTSLLDAIQGQLPTGEILQLLGNNSTKQVGVYSTFHIDFSAPKSPHKILGFPQIFLRSHRWYISSEPVGLRHLHTIRIHCNIVAGAFDIGGPHHVLYEFAPKAPPGHQLIEEPQNIVYLPIISHNRVSEIIVTITDEKDRPLDFGGQEIHLKLDLRRWD